MAGPTYTYSPTVPQGPTPFNDTQSPILNNFKAIEELIAVNHVGFNVADNYGKHNFCSLLSQDALPPVTETDSALFTQPVLDSPFYQLFYEYPDGTVNEISAQQASLVPQTPYIPNVITFANGFTIGFAQIGIGGSGTATNFITNGVNVSYKNAPFVAISQSAATYYPFTRHGAYNITQTQFFGNYTSNQNFSFLSFGF